MHTPPPQLPQLTGQAVCIDTHCHLDMEDYQADLDEVVASAARHGVTRIVTIGTDLVSSQAAVRLAARYPGLYAAVGIHPQEADQATPEVLEKIRRLARQPKVVGYGEIGLDYVKNYTPAEIQLLAFASQLQLAKEVSLPVIIHDREAHADILRLIQQAAPFPRRGVMHCFSGDLALAEASLDLGFYLSIPGVATFANAQPLREVIKAIALEHLVLETDGPFLTPVPYRGKRNEPKYVLYTAQMVADIKKLPLEEVVRVTTANAINLFNLPENQNDT